MTQIKAFSFADGKDGGLAKDINDFVEAGRVATGAAHVAFVERLEVHSYGNTAILYYSDCEPR